MVGVLACRKWDSGGKDGPSQLQLIAVLLPELPLFEDKLKILTFMQNILDFKCWSHFSKMDT